jgi:hypothetical protein
MCVITPARANVRCCWSGDRQHPAIRQPSADRPLGDSCVRTIGIDPGLTGAVAVLEPDGQLRAYFDLPVIRDRTPAWIDGDRLGQRHGTAQRATA